MLLLAAGCRPEKTATAARSTINSSLARDFDATATGKIVGRVTWSGEFPNVPAFQVHAYLDYLNRDRLRGEYPNPHAPRIEPMTRGVGQAAITLRGLIPERSRPWHHPTVQVMIQPDGLEVVQGDSVNMIGFVQRGAAVECLSRDDDYQILRARGAAFFTLPFAVKDRPSRRQLDQNGVVELSMGAGHYWRRAHLFVAELPYGTLTQSDGRFVLDQVPAGTYELAAWLPNWHIESKEHDPETGVISRLVFASPVELTQSVTVLAGQASEAFFAVSPGNFDRK